MKQAKLRAAQLKETLLQRSRENESGGGGGGGKAKSAEVEAWKRKLTALREAKDEKIISLSDSVEERDKDLLDHQKFIAQLKKRNEHLNAKNEGLMMHNGELEQQVAGVEALEERIGVLQAEKEQLVAMAQQGQGGDEYVDVEEDGDEPFVAVPHEEEEEEEFVDVQSEQR